jgi:hypothetical protein
MFGSEPDMKRAARLVRYEWDLFSWAATVLQGTDAWYVGAGTGTDPEQDDAVREVFLLHARNLRDFFSRRRSALADWQRTDILAEDFLDNPALWRDPAFSYLTHSQTKERLDRALAHLSYTRLNYEATGKEWEYDAVFAELATAWAAFLAALGDRKAWFDLA